MLECPVELGVFLYRLNHTQVLLDVATSLTFEIDEVTADVLKLCGTMDNNEIYTALWEQYGSTAITDVLVRLGMLKRLGLLSSQYIGGMELDAYDKQNKVKENIEKNSELLKKYEKTGPPKVSVIIPAYNCEAFIAEAIDSVKNQTFKDFEIIVVNDGSTDGTEKILQRYGKNIKYVTQENRGLPAAINVGCSLATGRYIAHLDADDTYTPNTLEIMVEFLDNHPDIGLVYSNSRMHWQDEEGKERASINIPPEYNKNLLLHHCYFTHARVFHKVCWEMLGGFNEEYRTAEDYDFFLRLSENFKMAHINRVLHNRRIHRSSISSAQWESLRENSKRAVEEALKRRGLNYRVIQNRNLTYQLRKPGPRLTEPQIFSAHTDLRFPFLINLKQFLIDSQLLAFADWQQHQSMY